MNEASASGRVAGGAPARASCEWVAGAARGGKGPTVWHQGWRLCLHCKPVHVQPALTPARCPGCGLADDLVNVHDRASRLTTHTQCLWPQRLTRMNLHVRDRSGTAEPVCTRINRFTHARALTPPPPIGMRRPPAAAPAGRCRAHRTRPAGRECQGPSCMPRRCSCARGGDGRKRWGDVAHAAPARCQPLATPSHPANPFFPHPGTLGLAR